MAHMILTVKRHALLVAVTHAVKQMEHVIAGLVIWETHVINVSNNCKSAF